MAFRDLISAGRAEVRNQPAEHVREESPLFLLRREVNRLFDEVFRSFELPSSSRTEWPSIEVERGENQVLVKAELPGLSEKDVEISVDGDTLTVRGERRSDREDADRGYSEHFYGRFERHVALPKGADSENAKASFKDGILTVTLPLTSEADPGRRIPIEGA